MPTQYVCPICKTPNHEHQKYCSNCGTWLQSTAFPAKPISQSKSKSKSNKSKITIFIIILVLIGLYFWDNKTTLDRLDVGEHFKLTQLTVTRPLFRPPTASTQITSNIDITYPIEIYANFYDQNKNLLGTAKAVLLTGLSSNTPTTIELIFNGQPQLFTLNQIEVTISTLTQKN